MDNNYGGDDRENFNAEAENGEPENGRGDGEDFEKKKPWFLTPSVTVSKEYNSYRSGESVFEETVRENEGAFRGAVQLENEDPVTFYHRRRWEWGFARVQAKKRLGKPRRLRLFEEGEYLMLLSYIRQQQDRHRDQNVLQNGHRYRYHRFAEGKIKTKRKKVY